MKQIELIIHFQNKYEHFFQNYARISNFTCCSSTNDATLRRSLRHTHWYAAWSLRTFAASRTRQWRWRPSTRRRWWWSSTTTTTTNAIACNASGWWRWSHWLTDSSSSSTRRQWLRRSGAIGTGRQRCSTACDGRWWRSLRSHVSDGSTSWWRWRWLTAANVASWTRVVGELGCGRS